MSPAYRPHARIRMAQRKVTEADVEHVLANWTSRMVTPKNSVRYIGLPPGDPLRRELKVWVLPDEDAGKQQVVKSVAWKGEDDA